MQTCTKIKQSHAHKTVAKNRHFAFSKQQSVLCAWSSREFLQKKNIEQKRRLRKQNICSVCPPREYLIKITLAQSGLSVAGMNGKLFRGCYHHFLGAFAQMLQRHTADEMRYAISLSMKLHTSVSALRSNWKALACLLACRLKNFSCIKTFSHTRFIAQTRCFVNYDIRDSAPSYRWMHHAWEPALSAVIKRIHVWVAVSRSTLGMIIWAGALTFLPDFLCLGRVACSVFIQADQKHHLLTRTTLHSEFSDCLLFDASLTRRQIYE